METFKMSANCHPEEFALHGGLCAKCYRRTKTYKLTIDQINQMLIDQKNLCAICEKRPATVIDHDHETGKTRAFLCSNCNVALGKFLDSPELLEKAANYIRKFKNA